MVKYDLETKWVTSIFFKKINNFKGKYKDNDLCNSRENKHFKKLKS